MNDEEQWRCVAGFPDYRISDRGRIVRAVASAVGGYCGKEMKPTATSRYVRVTLSRDGRQQKNVSVARLVLASFGKPPADPHHVVAYRDGDCRNVALANLYWADHNLLAARHRPGTRVRACLRCRQHFQSTWIGNRMCTTCRQGRPSRIDDSDTRTSQNREVREHVERERRERLRRALRDDEPKKVAA